jgi:hypothetical protein
MCNSKKVKISGGGTGGAKKNYPIKNNHPTYKLNQAAPLGKKLCIAVG